MRVTFRPLPVWPYRETPYRERRSRSTFRVSYPDTLADLAYQIMFLNPGYDVDDLNVVFGAGFEERDIRKDGQPRADARALRHPGVEISFDSMHGRLTYATDTCELWQHNVRSIALGLDALRAVDRYGISQHGQQYAGFIAIPADTRLARGEALIRQHGSAVAALKATHPDHGGDPRDFDAVRRYQESLK